MESSKTPIVLAGIAFYRRPAVEDGIVRQTHGMWRTSLLLAQWGWIWSLLPHARGCDTFVTGHQQLGWISLACTGRGNRIAAILGGATATGLEPHLFFFKICSKGERSVSTIMFPPSRYYSDFSKLHIAAMHSRSIFEYLDSASVSDPDAMATMGV